MLFINHVSTAVVGGIPKFFFHSLYKFLGFFFCFYLFQGTDEPAFGYDLFCPNIFCDSKIHNPLLPPFLKQCFHVKHIFYYNTNGDSYEKFCLKAAAVV